MSRCSYGVVVNGLARRTVCTRACWEAAAFNTDPHRWAFDLGPRSHGELKNSSRGATLVLAKFGPTGTCITRQGFSATVLCAPLADDSPRALRMHAGSPLLYVCAAATLAAASPAPPSPSPPLTVSVTATAAFTIRVHGSVWLASAPLRVFLGGAWHWPTTPSSTTRHRGSDLIGNFTCTNVTWMVGSAREFRPRVDVSARPS